MLQLSFDWLLLFVFILVQHCRIHYYSLLDKMHIKSIVENVGIYS